ncbi:unnamed protein product [Echinostoma caproni]|uniref:Uncharacterized protein n=1 Tax=Echinostoma caproni TaxID=27848 RepID=A0A183BBW9_9TREM|nr:unnamed protein product [Echinostoma caproni]
MIMGCRNEWNVAALTRSVRLQYDLLDSESDQIKTARSASIRRWKKLKDYLFADRPTKPTLDFRPPPLLGLVKDKVTNLTAPEPIHQALVWVGRNSEVGRHRGSKSLCLDMASVGASGFPTVALNIEIIFG